MNPNKLPLGGRVLGVGFAPEGDTRPLVGPGRFTGPATWYPWRRPETPGHLTSQVQQPFGWTVPIGGRVLRDL